MSVPLLIYWAFSAVILAVAILALWKGGPAERIGASLILGLVVVGRLVEIVVPEDLHSVLHLTEDGLTAIGLLAVAVFYASFWLGGAMLLYAALFALHATYFVLGREQDKLYVLINDTCFMGVVACMAVATALAWRKRVRAREAAVRTAAATAAVAGEPGAA
jgi:hypothetical protein